MPWSGGSGRRDGSTRSRTASRREERVGATARRRRPAAIQGRRALAGGAILLVRVTYEIFAAFWPTAPKDEGFSDRMNDIPKYVVSKTLESPSWRNSTVIRDDPVEAIIDLKQEPSGNILLYVSG